jgi:hypothetical protein
MAVGKFFIAPHNFSQRMALNEKVMDRLSERLAFGRNRWLLTHEKGQPKKKKQW